IRPVMEAAALFIFRKINCNTRLARADGKFFPMGTMRMKWIRLSVAGRVIFLANGRFWGSREGWDREGNLLLVFLKLILDATSHVYVILFHQARWKYPEPILYKDSMYMVPRITVHTEWSGDKLLEAMANYMASGVEPIPHGEWPPRR